MWTLIFTEKHGGYEIGDLHLVSRGKFAPSNHNMDVLEYHEIPDQDLSHLYKGEPSELVGKLSDLKQYTPEEAAKTPAAAWAALKARGPATSETMPGLLERIVLIERVLELEG